SSTLSIPTADEWPGELRPRASRVLSKSGAAWHKLPIEVVVVTTRNVVLSEHQYELVDSLVNSGRYQNASEVLRAGLRLLARQETEEAAKLAALRQAADRGWSDLAAGRYQDVADGDLESFIERLGPDEQPHV